MIASRVPKWARPYLKRAVVDVLGSHMAIRRKLASISTSSALTILNFHRVDDDTQSAYEALHPALFDELIGWLKGRFNIVTFRELGNRRMFDKPPLILSFDDGYRDFINVVVPILEKHRVAANQNIIPGCVDSELPPLNVIIQDYIGSAPVSLLKEISFPGLPYGVDPRNRVQSGMQASAAIKHLPIAEQKSIFAALNRQFERFDDFKVTRMMTADQIKQIAKVHEIGVHSFEHATMAMETDEYLAADIRRCSEWFSRNLVAKPGIYAFPNGVIRQGQAQIVRNAGIPVVLVVGEAYSHSDAWLHSRFTFHAKSSAEARFRSVGGFATPGDENRFI